MGLIAWYKFDEGFGSMAADSSGNGLDLTLVNSPTWSTSSPENPVGPFSLEFVQANQQYGYKVYDALMDIQETDTVSISFWMYVSQYINQMNIIIHGDGGHSANYGVQVSGTDPYNLFLSGGDGYLFTGYNLPTNTRVFITITFNGSYYNLYANTILKQTIAGTGFRNINPFPLYIGWNNFASQYFNGALDDVRIYKNVVLSDEEILDLYALGLTTTTSTTTSTSTSSSTSTSTTTTSSSTSTTYPLLFRVDNGFFI